jgi:uncharacterized protein (DUF1501 family)
MREPAPSSRPLARASGDCCNEFSRSQALRRAIAGAGLPEIEAGMPLPAGTGLSRRTFLARSAGLALAVYGAGRLPVLDDGIAAAAGGSDRVLVTVFLQGGVDSLSMLFPSGDPLYRKLRPQLALSGGETFAEDGRLSWHPALAPLAALHADGKLSVLPAVGYTHADQSHFTSRHFWEVGATDARLRTGWLGRYLDRAGTPDNPLQGLSLDYQLAPVLAAARVPVAAVAGPDAYRFWSPNVWGQVEARMLEAIASFGHHASSRDPALADAGRIAAQSERLRGQLAPFAEKGALTVPPGYPSSRSGFPKQLAGLAAMLGAGLPLHCVALSGPGQYDTHADQPDALAQGLSLTAASLLAFQRDLEARGLADRVLTLVWSEFGRRAQENGSRGTDHGAAGAAFVLGTRAGGRMVGEFPGLGSGLDEDGNLRPTSDFRGLYAALLEQWLGADPAGIVPSAGKFERPQIVK